MLYSGYPSLCDYITSIADITWSLGSHYDFLMSTITMFTILQSRHVQKNHPVSDIACPTREVCLTGYTSELAFGEHSKSSIIISLYPTLRQSIRSSFGLVSLSCMYSFLSLKYGKLPAAHAGGSTFKRNRYQS